MLEKKYICYWLLLGLILLLLQGCVRIDEEKETTDLSQKAQENVQWVSTFDSSVDYVLTAGNFVFLKEDKSIYKYNMCTASLIPFGTYTSIYYNDGILVCNNNQTITYEHISGVQPDTELFSNKDFDLLDQNLNVRKGSNGLYGYVNTQGYWWIKPQYSYVDPFSEGYAYVERDGGNVVGFINQSNVFTKLCIQDGVARENPFSNERLLIQTYGNAKNNVVSTYITTDNKILQSNLDNEKFPRTNYPYQNARNFSEQMAAVEVGGLWGYINSKGDLIIPAIYKDAYSFAENIAIVKKVDGTYSQIDKYGNELRSLVQLNQYIYTGEYHDGLYQVVSKNSGHYNLVNDLGEKVSAADYEIIVWDTPYWRIYQSLTSAFVYLTQLEVLVPAFSIQPYSSYFIFDSASTTAFNSLNNKLYTIGLKKGEISEGLVAIQDKGGQYGYVDIKGNWIIYPQFIDAKPFCNGVAFVKTNEQSGLISNPLRYNNMWEKDVIQRAQILKLIDSPKMLEENITCVEFLNNIYVMCALLKDLQSNGELMSGADFTVMRDQLFLEIGVTPFYTENTPLTNEVAAYILTAFSNYIGNQVSYFYFPYKNENMTDYTFRDSIAYLSSMGILTNEAIFEPEKIVNKNEAYTLLTLFFESVSK